MSMDEKVGLLSVDPRGKMISVRPKIDMMGRVGLIASIEGNRLYVHDIFNRSEEAGWGGAMVLSLMNHQDEMLGRSYRTRVWYSGFVKPSGVGFWLWVQSSLGVVLSTKTGTVLPNWEQISEWKKKPLDSNRVLHSR